MAQDRLEAARVGLTEGDKAHPNEIAPGPARLHEHPGSRLAVDRSPQQPQPFASDHDSHLVEVPLGAWPRTKPTEVTSERWPELENPASNRFIGDVEPAPATSRTGSGQT